MHVFLSNLANRQTDRQTRAITFRLPPPLNVGGLRVGLHLVMILNQLLDGQHGKSVGGLLEKVSNSLLLTDIPTTKEIETTLQ